MAHEISNNSGQYEAFYTQEPAWHKLGTVVKDAPTSEEAISLAHLDWEVEKQPIYSKPIDSIIQESREIVIPKRFATMRMDTLTPLGVVGNVYKIIQNSQAFSFLDSLVSTGGLKYESAGALRDGSYVWMLAKFPEVFEVTSDDISENYILLVNTHDGKHPLMVLPTNVRVVCMNTLSYATRMAKKMVRISHKGNMEMKIEEARSVLGILSSEVQQFNQLMKELSGRPVVQSSVDSFINEMFPLPTVENDEQAVAKTRLKNIRNKVEENFERMDTRATKGTAYGLLNSMTEYVDHQRSARGTNEMDKQRSRFDGANFGTGNGLKQKALQYLTR